MTTNRDIHLSSHDGGAWRIGKRDLADVRGLPRVQNPYGGDAVLEVGYLLDGESVSIWRLEIDSDTPVELMLTNDGRLALGYERICVVLAPQNPAATVDLEYAFARFLRVSAEDAILVQTELGVCAIDPTNLRRRWSYTGDVLTRVRQYRDSIQLHHEDGLAVLLNLRDGAFTQM